MLKNPPVLILDEPASGLDPRARIEIKALLKELRSMGKTILISSHILTELADCCTSIGIIERGHLLMHGPIDEVVTHVYQLQNINAAQLVPILRPLIPQYGHLAAHPGSNMLIISDRAANVERMVTIIRRIDQSSDEDVEAVEGRGCVPGQALRPVEGSAGPAPRDARRQHAVEAEGDACFECFFRIERALAADALVAPQRLLSLALIYATVGDHEAALDRIETLLAVPSWLSVSLLEIDPRWAGLREHARYRALVEGSDTARRSTFSAPTN